MSRTNHEVGVRQGVYEEGAALEQRLDCLDLGAVARLGVFHREGCFC